MYWINYSVLALIGVYIIFLLTFFVLSGQFRKCFYFNLLSGIIALLLLAVFGSYLDINLKINIYTVSVSAFWGIPGIIMLMVLNIILL